jgi:hypothetical protein
MSDDIADHAAIAVRHLAGMSDRRYYLETQMGQVELIGVRSQSVVVIDGSPSNVVVLTTLDEYIPDAVQRLTGMTVDMHGERRAITRTQRMSGGVVRLELGRV